MSKATDIIGGLGSVAASAINAWNGANPITGVSETANNINMLGNTQYAPGDLTNLSNQFTAATNIQTNGLLNRQNETFGQLFASGLEGMQAGHQLGSAIDSSIKETKKAYGGHLHSLGGDIGALVGAVMNPTLMAISGAVQDNKMKQFSDQFDTLSNLALQRNTQNFSNAITDSTNMMFDNKALQMKAYGGPLGYFWDTFDNGVRVIKEGGTHEENPHQGVPQGIAPDGLPNLVEEGEVIYNDFVYSDRLKLTKEQAQQLKLGGEMSYAQAALKLSKESEERPNDIISKNGLRDSMNKLKVMQEELKAKNDAKKAKRELNKLLKELPVMEEQPVEPSMQEQMIDPMSMIQQPQMMAKGGHLFSGETEMSGTLNQQIESFPTDVRFAAFNQQTPTLWDAPIQQKKGSPEQFLYNVSTGNDIDYPNIYNNYDIAGVFTSGRVPIASMFNYDLTSPASILGKQISVADPYYLHTSNREDYLKSDLAQASPYKSIVTNQKQKQVVQPTNWYNGLKEITDVNDTTGDILHINGKRYRLPQINPFDSNYNGQQLHYVEAKPEVKDKDGNVTQAAVPGHWEVTQGNGAQSLPQDSMADMMRMAPVWGSLAQSIQAASTKPNYQHQDAAIRAASQIPYVNYTPIGNYERFDRIDPNTQANALRAQYAQVLSNMQNSGASRAAVNALQTNALQGLAGALGEAAQTGRTYNNTLKEKEIATQLGIDQTLLGASLDASKTNQGRASTYAQMVGAMAPAKQAIDDAIETNKYTTQTAVANNLGNVGIDKLNRLMQQWMIERGVYPGVAPTKATGGKLKYKTYRKKK